MRLRPSAIAIIRFGLHFFALAEYVWIVASTRYLGFVILRLLNHGYARKCKQETQDREYKEGKCLRIRILASRESIGI